MSYREERIAHCERLVASLHPCPCGGDSVEIEPCQITCESETCRRQVSGINWDDVVEEWNRGIPAGDPPTVFGSV